jgi:hypothetical protein
MFVCRSLPYADRPMDEKYFFCECGEVGVCYPS